MPRLITAAFRGQAEAEQALQSLLSTGVARDRIALYGVAHHPSSELAPGRTTASGADAATLGALGLPASEVDVLAGALARGHAIVTARVEDEASAVRALDVLKLFDAVDLGGSSGAAARTGGPGAPLAAGLTAGGDAGASNTAALPGAGTLVDGGDSGTGDLRADETLSLHNQGGVSTGPTTGREEAESRAGMPGATALEPEQAGDTFRRETDRSGAVRVYVR